MRLSSVQKNVIEMMKSGYCLWTSEGKNFKAWIGNESGEKEEGVSIKTAEILLNKGIIKFVDGEYRDGLFKYMLS